MLLESIDLNDPTNTEQTPAKQLTKNGHKPKSCSYQGKGLTQGLDSPVGQQRVMFKRNKRCLANERDMKRGRLPESRCEDTPYLLQIRMLLLMTSYHTCYFNLGMAQT